MQSFRCDEVGVLVLQKMMDEQLADELKKPVVVFVRDQLMTDADCRYSPGGASLTDSGRGNSDCGEEQSTPSMTSSSAKTSPRHDVSSKFDQFVNRWISRLIV